MLATARTFFLKNREGGAVLTSSALFMTGAVTLIWVLGSERGVLVIDQADVTLFSLSG
jgi:hypothetical protein